MMNHVIAPPMKARSESAATAILRPLDITDLGRRS